MASLEVDQHMMDLYDFKRRIGKGAYGIVWKAIDRRTKEVVAVKKIFDAFKNKTDAQRTYREITFLRAFGVHRNVIKLKAVHKANNNMDIYLVFEYMDTDLHNAINTRGVLTDIHKRYVMFQLLNATKFIHSGNVIHRDQKPSNILLDKYCRCKLADFGLARSLKDTENKDKDTGHNPLTDYVATRWYRPPEVLVGSKRYTKGIDMWSLGCILAEMLLGKAIFPGNSTVDQVERILMVLGPPSIEDMKAICSSGIGIGLLSRAPRAQSPLRNLLKGHPNDAVDLVSRLLVLNPEKRLSANEALNHNYVLRFHEDSPTVGIDVLPLLSDDHQWTVDQYRNQLYEELNVLPCQRTNTLHKSHSHPQANILKNSRSQSSSQHMRRSSHNPTTKKITEVACELRKNCVILPPVEAQYANEPNRHRCKCKKNGCHRNNGINVPFKTVVPEVVQQGPKFHQLNKYQDREIDMRNGKHLTSHTRFLLPQACSTPITVPSNKNLRYNGYRI